jgi:DNA-binding transcriptional ArsR family regulator
VRATSAAALLAMLLVATPAAGRTIVDAGVAAVEADLTESGRCIVPLEADLCPASYVPGPAPGPGDDAVFLDKTVEEVRIRSGAGTPMEVVVDPSEVRVRHPVNRFLNATWPGLDALVAPAGGVVYFESGTLHDDPEDWGVFVGVRTGNPALDPYLKYGHCWDPCFLDGEDGYASSDEDELHPLPRDVVAHTTDSDEVTAWWLREGTPYGLACDPESAVHGLGPQPCGQAEALQPHGESARALLAEVTPQVALGFRLDRTVVQLGLATAHRGSVPDALGRESEGRGSATQGQGAVGREDLFRATADEDPASGVRSPTGAPIAARSEGPLMAASPRGLDPTGSWLLLATVVGATLLLAAALYHRITQARALQQVTRKRLFEAIQADPGVRCATLAHRLDLDVKTVLHHLRLLEGLGYIMARGQGQKHYFAQGTDVRQADLIAGPLAAPAAKALKDLLDREGPMPLRTAAARLGIAVSTASQEATRLGAAGLIARQRSGRLLIVGPLRCVAPPPA